MANKILDVGDKKIYLPSLIYGVEAAVTTFACLVELFYLDVPQSDFTKLFGFYLPTLIIPVFLSIDMYQRLSALIFPPKTKEKAEIKLN